MPVLTVPVAHSAPPPRDGDARAIRDVTLTPAEPLVPGRAYVAL